MRSRREMRLATIFVALPAALAGSVAACSPAASPGPAPMVARPVASSPPDAGVASDAGETASPPDSGAPPPSPAAPELVLVAGGDVEMARTMGKMLLKDPSHDPWPTIAPLLAGDLRFCNLESQ